LWEIRLWNVQKAKAIVKGQIRKRTMPLLRRAITVIKIVALWGMCMVVSPAGASLPTQDLSSLPTVHSLDPLQFGKISPPSTLFRSRLAQNVCVTIINHGAGTTKVRLFRDQKHIGEFLVKPEKLSSICSQVTLVELQCTTGHCQAGWRIRRIDEF
jgi:hypothetical protein